MESEYSSLLKNDTWDLVPPPEGKNIVGSRWVLKVKRNENGSVNRFKADLLHKDILKWKVWIMTKCFHQWLEIHL